MGWTRGTLQGSLLVDQGVVMPSVVWPQVDTGPLILWEVRLLPPWALLRPSQGQLGLLLALLLELAQQRFLVVWVRSRNLVGRLRLRLLVARTSDQLCRSPL